MKTVAFFDSKPYDKLWFDRLKKNYDIEIRYFESKLNRDTAAMATGYDGVVAFVNDSVDADVIGTLKEKGVGIVAMRCAGYNNVDFRAAAGKVRVTRVPAYSPHAVAEHAMALLLCLNRKIHRAYNRTRDANFSIQGLVGFDLYGKTAGIVGTGKIGRVFHDICLGFGMKALAYDIAPAPGSGINYVPFETLCAQSDVISLHCPLTKETAGLIGRETLARMKNGVYLINTSRGPLVDSEALVEALKSGKVGGAGLDVYDEEGDYFYEDLSDTVLQDDTLARLTSFPNVIVTSHQAFLTEEALFNIAKTTLENLKSYFDGRPLENEIAYA